MTTKTGKPWPNGLGWDMRTPHGTAEVRDMVRTCRVFVPLPPLGKHERYRVCDVPLGTPPDQAVMLAADRGVIQVYNEPWVDVPFISNPVEV